ncbi:phosphatase PAP2 family protein [Paenibacillus sp. FJAT-26967]|uniref:phosphatase PAP2 family protein n=1 Tax=Paenibacillus sp. FJAT-26967 TaxID=1729690 RepID=UPI000A021BC2|nr:phosphatase PAP2 family protein [Paenibacillus sp. FJAT-26967]
MHTKLQGMLTRAFLISLFTAVGFGVIALLVSQQKIAAFDLAIISAVQGLESPGWTRFAILLDKVGSTAFVPVITVVAGLYLYVVLKHRSELVLLIAAIGGAALLNTILKKMFQRERPTLNIIMEETGFSFPSGHSMAGFALYGILIFLLWKHIRSTAGRAILLVLAGGMILVMGISRIYLGVHYPSDVLGGFLASAFWLTVCIWTYQRYQLKREQRTGRAQD